MCVEVLVQVRAPEGVMVDGRKYNKGDELMLTRASAQILTEQKKVFPIVNPRHSQINGRFPEIR